MYKWFLCAARDRSNAMFFLKICFYFLFRFFHSRSSFSYMRLCQTCEYSSKKCILLDVMSTFANIYSLGDLRGVKHETLSRTVNFLFSKTDINVSWLLETLWSYILFIFKTRWWLPVFCLSEMCQPLSNYRKNYKKKCKVAKVFVANVLK